MTQTATAVEKSQFPLFDVGRPTSAGAGSVMQREMTLCDITAMAVGDVFMGRPVESCPKCGKPSVRLRKGKGHLLRFVHAASTYGTTLYADRGCSVSAWELPK